MKKLIYGIIILILLVVIANFTLWFFNTKAINQSIEQLKTALSDDDLEFTYSEVKFDSFKSWRIEGVIVEPSLKSKIFGKLLNLHVPRVHFISYPFSDELELSTPGDHFLYKFTDKLMNTDENVKVQYDTQSPPTLNFSFNKSFSELVPLFKEDNYNLFKALKNISLKASGLNFIDNHTSALVSKTGGIDIEANFAPPANNEINFEGLMKIKDVIYNPDYIASAPAHKKELYEHLVKVGATNIDLDFAFHESGKSEKSHGDYNFNLKKLDYKNNIYAIDAKGTLELPGASTFPYVDMTLNVSNYIEMIDFYDGFLKAAYNSLGSQDHHARTFTLSEEHSKALKHILASFATADNKKLVLTFNRTADKDFTLSGRSFPEVLSMLQPLFETQAEHLKSTTAPIKPGAPALPAKPEMTIQAPPKTQTNSTPTPAVPAIPHPAPTVPAPSERK